MSLPTGRLCIITAAILFARLSLSLYNPLAMNKQQITRDLARIVGQKFVLSHPDDLRVYSSDASNNAALPDYVVVPENAEQVSRVVKLARKNGLAIVPRGAGTGLCGGITPIAGGIMIAFGRMKKILEIDFENRVAVVEAGLDRKSTRLNSSHQLISYAVFCL